MTDKRTFTPPWQVDDTTSRESFIIRDAKGQPLCYLYYEENVRRMSMGRLTKDEARRIAVNIAKLPDLVKRPQY